MQRTFKKREGVWGIVKGDKGGASQVAPLSPLTKEKHIWNPQEILVIVIASEHSERGNQPCAKLESWGFFAV